MMLNKSCILFFICLVFFSVYFNNKSAVFTPPPKPPKPYEKMYEKLKFFLKRSENLGMSEDYLNMLYLVSGTYISSLEKLEQRNQDEKAELQELHAKQP